MIKNLNLSDTIVALATPQGTGAIAIIRLSGKNTIKICNNIFRNKNLSYKDLSNQKPYTIHYGIILDKKNIIDEVLISLFFSPHSYTGEDVIEISCHGSIFIQQQIIQLLIREGARLANPGEFTLRAFLNKKLDLSQAEAVADLIASRSETAHQLAMRQMRGHFSSRIKLLREKLINFASLIELELDFGEEDVEFADRNDLKSLIAEIIKVIQSLIDSFEIGNVIKKGVPVAIVGKPNTGKSTLLNLLLNEERAIVSEIAGTTRDTIEDEIIVGGVSFRFIDTAGIRKTSDIIESSGVNRTFEKIQQAAIVIYLFDVNKTPNTNLKDSINELQQHLSPKAELIIIGNKIDETNVPKLEERYPDFKNIVFISAKNNLNINELTKRLISIFNKSEITNNTVVTNARHVEALHKINEALKKVYEGLNQNITGDLLTIDIRTALHYLGEITGEVSTDTLLENIFSKFCIGK